MTSPRYTLYIIYNDFTRMIDRMAAFVDNVGTEEMITSNLAPNESVIFYSRNKAKAHTYCTIKAIKDGQLVVEGLKYWGDRVINDKTRVRKVKAKFV